MLRTDDYLIYRARSYCHHCGLQHLALGLLWQHDATFCHRLSGKTLHQHSVKQGEEFSEGLRVTKGNKKMMLISNTLPFQHLQHFPHLLKEANNITISEALGVLRACVSQDLFMTTHPLFYKKVLHTRKTISDKIKCMI